ncbi:MAG: PPOX class F420-dependent oxidoreductase [Acidobacteriota bacterium]|nr:PPOX class F420-dependent oxidoreductase [Acidobacteriota bacterium]
MTTFPDSHKDLLDAPVAQLATVGRDGYPQVTSTWFIFDEGAIKLSLNATRVKTRNLARDPKVSLLIADPQNPYRYLAVRADAVISPDTAGADAAKVNAKYNADVQDNDRPGDQRVTVTLEPVGIFSWPASEGH